ncbi:MAG: hypothetical protein ACR2K4_08945 [Candidatus Limnocylindria bacterium]
MRRYAATLLSHAIGLECRLLDAPSEREVYVHHGTSQPARARAIVIPATPAPPPTEVTIVSDGRPVRMSHDILEATVALVTDAVHADLPAGSLDRHGRLRADASHFAAVGMAGEPVVDAYAALLSRTLDRIGAKPSAAPRWPNGARAAIGLSHDVDRPDKYAILRAARGARLPPPGRLPWFLARAARDMVHRAFDRNPNDFWLFDELVQAEAELGMRSTFLFSVIPAYASYGSPNDVLYDAAWPHLRSAMRSLRARGIEIGLHASYHAFRERGRFAEEKARLEELSEGPVNGLRHHFWQVGSDLPRTLRAHEDAGFRYDSSIAFNDAIGLRRSLALPYRPWDAELERPLNTWQLPVLALDSAACSGMTSVEDGIDRLWSAIERVVELGGVGVLDWHVRCAVPGNDRYRTWAGVYLGVLERLSHQSDVWVAPLGEIAEWADTRFGS